MTNNNNTNSDETVVNPTYTAISHKDTTISSNTTELQINQAHSTINEEEIINSSDETVINPTYGTIGDGSTSSRSDEARKLQTQGISTCVTVSDNKDITTNSYEITEPPRNAVSDDDTTAIGNDIIVNPEYTVVSVIDRATEPQRNPVDGAENVITNNDETIANPVYIYAEVNDKMTVTGSSETVKLERNSAYATISDILITTSSDKVQRSPSKKTTTNRDETIVNPTYAAINDKHAPDNNSTPHPATAEDTNIQHIVTSSETIRLQRNPAYAVPSEVHLYEEIN